jgi:hypothetical protein
LERNSPVTKRSRALSVLDAVTIVESVVVLRDQHGTDCNRGHDRADFLPHESTGVAGLSTSFEPSRVDGGSPP